jgi:hypothetical protein
MLDHGPGVELMLKLEPSFGKRARTCQVKMPTPVILSQEAAVDGNPPKSSASPSGSCTWRSYEIAPGTGFQPTTGRPSPAVMFVGSSTGAGRSISNVPQSDQVSPTLFSSFAWTRQ